MKKISILITGFLWMAASANAQLLKEIVERKWTGSSVQDVNFTNNGKVYLDQTLQLSLNDDQTINGTCTTIMKLDYKSYTCRINVTGTFNRENLSIFIQDGDQSGCDPLPGDLHWCKGWGTLRLFKDRDHPGYYILKGNVDDDCGGKSFMEFGDFVK